MEKRERLLYLDIEKTVAMFVIVLGHYGLALESYGIIGSEKSFIHYANGSFMAPAITIFFLVSGALLSHKYRNQKNMNLKEFYLNRMKRVLPLFWISYFVVFTIKLCFYNGFWTSAPHWKLCLSFTGMDGYFLYLGENYYILGEWFLGAIIIFYLLFPFIKSFMDDFPKILAVITLILYLGTHVFNPFEIFLERNLLVCISTCVLGMYIGKYVDKVNNLWGIASFAISFIFLFIPIAHTPFCSGSVLNANVLGVTIYIFVFWSSGFVTNGKLKIWFEKLSNKSYHVFLVHHVILLAVLRMVQKYYYGKAGVLGLTGVIAVLIYVACVLLDMFYIKVRSFLESTVYIIFTIIYTCFYKIYTFMMTHVYLVPVILPFIMGLIVYHKFVFGDYLYMTSYDAAEQFWPQLSYLRDYIVSEGFPGWSFSIGLGGVLDYCNLADIFYLIPVLAGKELMPYLFIWLQIIKIVLSSEFMYLFLKKIGIEDQACIFGGICYSFCSIIIIRGNWYHYSSEMVYLALLLYLLECFFKDGKWKSLVVLFFIIFSGRGAYFLYLYTILLIIYAAFRYILVDNKGIKNFGIYVWKCAKIYILSLLISAAFWIPSLYNMLTSYRIGNQIIEEKFIFSFENLLFVTNALLRLFRFDLSGSINYYLADYINAPLFYIGIIAIPFIIWATVYSSGYSKKTIIVFLLSTGLYLGIPKLRFALNGFILYEHLKLSCSWIVAGLIICASYGYQQVISFRRLNFQKTLITFLCIIVSILLCFYVNTVGEYETRLDALIYTFLFLLLYFVLIFCLYSSNRNSKTYGILLFLFICIELTCSSYTAANAFCTSTSMVLKSELNDKLLANSNIFSHIKISDKRTFYRISANECFNYTNPQMENYYDSSYYNSYVGGAAEFNRIMMPSTYKGASLGGGIRNNIAMESLIGCRYIVKKHEDTEPYDCIKKETIYNYDIYENPNAYDIGTFYNNAISQNTFVKIAKSEQEKGIVLLNTVVSDELEEKYQNLSTSIFDKIINAQNAIENFQQEESYFTKYMGIGEETLSGKIDKVLKFEVMEDNADIAVVISKEQILQNYRVNFDIISESNTTMEVIQCDGSNEYITKSYSIKKGANNVLFDSKNSKVQYFILRLKEVGTYKISDFKIMYQNMDSYFEYCNKLYDECIEVEKKGYFELSHFSQNHIAGSVHTSENGILLFTIPYDRNWKIYVDDIQTDTKKVNYGLTAIEVEQGNHEVELIYKNPIIIIGCIITCIGIIIYMLTICIAYMKMKNINNRGLHVKIDKK